MTVKDQTDRLASLLAPYGRQVQADLERWLVEPGCPPELAEALRYSVLGGGKRLRPALVYLCAEACGSSSFNWQSETAARCAVAVELIHCYSLVHDDLPAMDDDVLRRGRPTVHVKFGEAMAILAGDGLLTRAFGVLAQCPSGAPASELIAELALAAGQSGMIAGQVADMDLCAVANGLDGLRSIHVRKTGAMIRAAARMGALAAGASKEDLAAVTTYAEQAGLAFQVIDDVLDVSGAAEKIGKTPGKDQATGKRTYVSLIGLESARQLGRDLTAKAIEAVRPMGDRACKLVDLAELLTERTH